MKKVFALIFVVVLLLPVVSLSEGQAVAGVWYLFPGYSNNLFIDDGVTTEIRLFILTKDGLVYSSTYDIDKNGITTAKDYKLIGLWTYDNGKYYANIGMAGAHELRVEKDSLLIPIEGYSYRFHKMKTFNTVLDIVSE